MIRTGVIVFLSFALATSLVLHAWNPFAPRTAPAPRADLPPPPPPEPDSTALPDPQPEAPSEPPAPPETVDAEPARDPRFAAFDAVFDTAPSLPGLEGASLGFCLLDERGEVLYGYNARTAQIPASTLKTLTTATALEILGPDFRFETLLGLSSPSEDGVFDGDLVLLGGGDPTLTLADLRTWAEDLAAAGVERVTGRVVGDGRLFPGSVFPDFWDWGDIGNAYGSPVSGLNLERNRFVLHFQGGEEEGDPVELVEIDPEVPAVAWWNEVLTGPPGSGDRVTVYGGERAAVMHLRGTVPPEETLRVRGAAPDPELFAAHHLREALLAAGIEVAGEAAAAARIAAEGEEPPAIAEEILLRESPPLSDLVAGIHATSDNHETECLFRTLGLREGLPPEEVLRRHWAERGLEFSGLRMVDGSGLARADHITPLDLARIQHLAATGPAGETYVNSLLPAGHEDALRIKAGGMSAVRSYTGLAESASGERLSFALMINHFSDAPAVAALRNALFDAMLEW